MRLFKSKKQQGYAVQTARESPSPFGMLNNYVPLAAPENNLYDAIRESVPIVDAALEKIVRLVGIFKPACDDAQAKALPRFWRSLTLLRATKAPHLTGWMHTSAS